MKSSEANRVEREPHPDRVTAPGTPVMPDSTRPVTEREAPELHRSLDELVMLERPPHIVIGSAHHTLYRALEDIKVIASATIAWHRTHVGGVCPECTGRNEPWYCFHV